MRKLTALTAAAALAAVMGVSGFVVSTGQQAAALTGDSVGIGGQILEPNDDYKISFGGWGDQTGVGQFEGELQINFHRVGDPNFNKAKFHGVDVTVINFYDGNTDSCNAAMNMTVVGTLNGEPGYSVIFRAGDAGSPGNATAAEPYDTARIQLFEGAAVPVNEIYDTHDGDFADESNCVGSARTGLDRGNITIDLP